MVDVRSTVDHRGDSLLSWSTLPHLPVPVARLRTSSRLVTMGSGYVVLLLLSRCRCLRPVLVGGALVPAVSRAVGETVTASFVWSSGQASAAPHHRTQLPRWLRWRDARGTLCRRGRVWRWRRQSPQILMWLLYVVVSCGLWWTRCGLVLTLVLSPSSVIVSFLSLFSLPVSQEARGYPRRP